MSANLQFRADVAKFAKLVNDRVDVVLNGVAVALHGRLGEVTPYRSGRARASWVIAPNDPSLFVPPQILSDYWNASPSELRMANAFYDSIYDQMHRFEAPPGTNRIVISNSVDYIEELNRGSSPQAPAHFFEATVAGMELLVNKQIAAIEG